MQVDNLAKGFGLDSFVVLSTIKGGNSFVHKILHDGETYAIKQYIGTPERQNRSLNYESTALYFLNETKIIRCPEILGCNVHSPSILYRWVEGVLEFETSKVKETIGTTIQKLSASNLVDKYPLNAIDSVFNSDDLFSQLRLRFDDISKIGGLPLQLLGEIESVYDYIKTRFPSKTIYSSILLSLSDYGPHNLIRNEDQGCTHIDFEFFGVDSHVKVYSDLFCHPKSIFTSIEIREMLRQNHSSKTLEEEIFSVLPAIALKWVFIVLRRYINWETMEYESNVLSFSNPSDYLAYTKYLLLLRKFDEVITYSEFESL